jgi:hypothetical protein
VDVKEIIAHSHKRAKQPPYQFVESDDSRTGTRPASHACAYKRCDPVATDAAELHEARKKTSMAMHNWLDGQYACACVVTLGMHGN